MTPEKLERAVQLIQSGQKPAAVLLLREMIQGNPAQEDVWLLLSTCMDQVEHKRFCLQSVLKINPENQQAHDALAALNEPVPAPVVSTPPASVSWERTEREKFSWEQTESESVTWEKEQPEPVEEWQNTAPQETGWVESQPEKFEWERAVPEQAAWEKMQPLKMDWEEEAEPVWVKPAKSPSQPIPRHKARRKRFSFFPVVAALVLFTMLAFVCFVFLMQVLTTP